MSTEFIVALVIVGGIGTLLVLRYMFGFGAAECLFLFAAIFPTIWLGRFSEYFLTISESHVSLLWGILALTIIFLAPFRSFATCQLLRPPMGRIAVALFVLLSILLLSTFLNSREAADLLRGVQACGYVVMSMLAALSVVRCLPATEKAIAHATWALLLAGTGIAAMSIATGFAPWAFASLVEGHKTDAETGRAFTPLGGPNATAMCLLMVYCLATGQLLSGRKRLLGTLCMAVAFVGILMTLARAALIAFAVANAFLFFRYRYQLGRRLGILALLTMCIMIPVASRIAQVYSLERFISGTDRSVFDPSLDLRKASLETAIQVGTRHFLYGGGWGLVYPIHRTPTPLQQIPRVVYVEGEPSLAKPHSLFALVYAEGGGFALLALLWYLWRLWSSMPPPDPRVEPKGHYQVQGFRAAMLAFLVSSIVQDNLFISDKVALFFYMYVFLGILVSRYYQTAAAHQVAPNVSANRFIRSHPQSLNPRGAAPALTR